MKRLVAFLLLLGLGFGALWFLASEPPPGVPAEPVRRPAAGSGQPIKVRQGDLGIGLQIHGGFRIGQHRNVQVGETTVRQPVYDLTCQDCAPMPDGRHRLDGVTVALYDQGLHAADLQASQALVELQEDAGGQRSIREDKQLDLQDAVFTTVPGGRYAPMRIELGRVAALVAAETVDLRTPDENEPVLVVVEGEQPSTLRGRGLVARLPRNGGRADDRLDITVLREPSVQSAGVDVRASSAMHYVEDLAAGAALLTVGGDVQLALDRSESGADGPGSPVQVRGDRLRAWLQRDVAGTPGAPPAGRSMVWNRLRLDGSPARVDGPDFELTSPRLSIVPGPSGRPWLITAQGGESELRQKGTGAGDGVAFRSTWPIHLIRPGEQIGPVHEAFGFPADVLRPLRDLDVVVLEGAPRLETADGLAVVADRGLIAFRLAAGTAAAAVVALGAGNVRIEHGAGDERTVATGDAGFLLRRTAAGDELRLGRDDPGAVQRFHLQRGDGDDRFELQGLGACRLVRSADGAGLRLGLRSSGPSIHGSFGAQLELHDADALDLELRGRELAAFRAAGAMTRLAFARQGERLQASAPLVEQTGPHSWRLTGARGQPARLSRPPDPAPRAGEPAGDLTAPRIDIHQLGGDAVLVDATADGDAPARLTGTSADGGDADVAARRIRLLPFAIAPDALAAHLAGLPAGLAAVTGVARVWLLAEQGVTADIRDSQQGDLHGEGALLALSQASQSALLIGDAATAAPAIVRTRDRDGREVTAAGARVLGFRADGDHIRVLPHIRVLTTFPGRSLLLPPRVTFRDPRQHGRAAPFANLHGECAGEIEIAPEAVSFHGPVTAQGLRADGTVDPRGVRVVAQQLSMRRLRDTGEIARVEADGGVVIDWDDLHGESRWLELDVRRQRCIARGPEGARIRMPDGRTFSGSWLEANYVTHAVRGYDVRSEQEGEPALRR